ncbi:MAG: hypothetical protein HYY06_19235 [Deltaproteobacteria bacterium]|nr:hypothetical protein [Deltaproteobacteria bacterium]
MRNGATAGLLLLLVEVPVATVRAEEWFVEADGSGGGTADDPFGSVQDGLDVAGPGDVITVREGTYSESLRTVRGGTEAAPIVLRRDPARGPTILSSSGRVLRVEHPYFVVEGLILDGQYGPDDALAVRDEGDHFVLRDSEIRRSGRDCLDMSGQEGVLVERSLIHHCLDSTDGRRDAHGIVGGPMRGLVIRDTEIHTFSGDAVQLDPDREQTGWTDVTIEGCELWLEPLPAAEAGFSAGTVPGENGVDTKATEAAPRAMLIISDTVARGFRRGLVPNMAAFNIKENVDCTLDRVTVHDSEIAFRTRGPTDEHPLGSWVRIANAVVFDVEVGVRYENDIERLAVLGSTFGRDVERPFDEAEAAASVLDVRNLLVLSETLPGEAIGPTNLAVGESAFIDATSDDYHLSAGSPAIDRGEPIEGVSRDRDGVARPQGDGIDIGAYEWCGECPEPGNPDAGGHTQPGPDGGADAGAADDRDTGSPVGADAGGAPAGGGFGCSCNATRSAPGASWLAWIAGVAGSLASGRRSRRGPFAGRAPSRAPVTGSGPCCL